MKASRKILYLFVAMAGMTCLSSCESLLDIPQKGVRPMEGFYQTDEDCQEAVTSMYASMKNLVQGQYSPVFVTNLLSDDCYSGASARYASDDKESINEYRYDAANPVVEDIYEGLYALIYRCNLVINNFEDGTSDIQKRAVAEAKVFRAYSYFHLVTLFANVPLITEAVRDDYKAGPGTPEAIWGQVETDLKEAIDAGVLPVKTGMDDRTTGIRVTEDFARSMLGKTYVFLERWSEAAEQLDAVIASGRYGFLDSYEDYAKASNNNNREVIFSDNKNNDPNNEGSFMLVLYNWNNQYFSGLGLNNELGSLGFGFFSPSKSLVDAFIEMEGEGDARGKRFRETLKSYDDMLEMGITLNTGMAAYAHCGYGYWKVRLRNADLLGNPTSSWQNDVVMRYAEVVLLAAEAHIMLNDGLGDQYINMIRDKAGLPRLAGATMDDLKKEKRLELCLEGCRYQDLIRWGDAAEVLGEQWERIPNFAGKAADGSYVLQYPDINVNATYGFVEGKHNLLPIPEREMNVNPNMKQNPGWTE